MGKAAGRDVRPPSVLSPIQALLAEILNRYGIGNKELAGILQVSDTEVYALLRGGRKFQNRHISAILEYLRRYEGHVRPWTRHDEYVLLATFVHGVEPVVDTGNEVSFDRSQFSLGGQQKAAIVYEFVEAGYDRQLLQCSMDTSPIATYGDAELDERYRTLFVEKDEEIRRSAFNGAGMTLSHIRTTRTDGDERPQVIMRFKPSDYVRRVTTRTIFSELPEDKRSEVLSSVHTEGVREGYCGGFGAVVSIITADRKLLFFQRSGKVAGDRGEYDCTIVESMDGKRDRDLSGQPSVLMNAIRGLAEEAALNGYEDDVQQHLRFHGFLCRSRYYEWAIYGSLDLSGTRLSADRLINNALEKWKRKQPDSDFTVSQSSEGLSTSFALARDAFEFQRYTAVPFTLKDVVRFIATNPVTDYSFVNAVMTLASVLNVSTLAIDRELRLYPPQASEEERESRDRERRQA